MKLFPVRGKKGAGETMQRINSLEQMQETAEALRLAGKTIALVPTMGFLHEGHLELMRVGKSHADVLVISIFVNPTQFGPAEDFEQYPRDREGDIAKARQAGVDLVFMPDAEEMYGPGFQSSVLVHRVTQHLCGVSRPTFFAGVATVVCKLFHLVKPHIAVFGQKDYQQLTVVSRMVTDLNMDIRIIGVPTVRDPDGLAMSSRNNYLTPEERKSALSLSRSLDLADEMVSGGERNPSVVKEAVEAFIVRHPYTKIEYVSLCHPVTLEELKTVEKESLLALAVWIGKTRLIDNRVLREKKNPKGARA
jgi:pantoate--beta-alanine ligase